MLASSSTMFMRKTEANVFEIKLFEYGNTELCEAIVENSVNPLHFHCQILDMGCRKVKIRKKKNLNGAIWKKKMWGNTKQWFISISASTHPGIW